MSRRAPIVTSVAAAKRKVGRFAWALIVTRMLLPNPGLAAAMPVEEARQLLSPTGFGPTPGETAEPARYSREHAVDRLPQGAVAEAARQSDAAAHHGGAMECRLSGALADLHFDSAAWLREVETCGLNASTVLPAGGTVQSVPTPIHHRALIHLLAQDPIYQLK